ncbi:F-box domain protein [Fonsecaea pedrosoi]|nr:F-box domain protein [Fonsecaea pedrosoi]
MEHLYPYPKMGTSFLEILQDPLTRKLLGFEALHAEPVPFISGVTSRVKFLLNDAMQQLSFLKIGYTALEAFLQANCTGPPLDFNTDEVIFPDIYRNEDIGSLKQALFEYLSVDGSRPYPLTPHIELFWLAKVILSNPTLAEAGFNGRRARFRVNFWHQKLLSEESPSLRDAIYLDAEVLERQLTSRLAFGGAAAEEHFVEFLIERAVVRTHYGDDALARADLAKAATTRHFQFVLTGALGKRTKFQDRDISQLVVLARSRDHEPEPYSSRKGSRAEAAKSSDTIAESDRGEAVSTSSSAATKPENLPLNDDTLLERIEFQSADSAVPVSEATMTHIASPDSNIPSQLASLDPASQPLLYPMDSIILLATASSITNTSPDDGLVREETLPYATRVLEGGSSNWQVYTQALLVRSRIEGYRSRTAERGLLQLQALVDQVIVETTSDPTASASDTKDRTTSATETADPSTKGATTFLPKGNPSESASVAERLKYIYQLAPPLRWELEAELAQRWAQLGGLKTALDIYNRLQMYAEVALCLAATDQEGKAVELLKDLLFEDSQAADADRKLRSPPPADAPRLLCILGDITDDPSHYSLAWTVSSSRYARAQRSLGRYYTKRRDFPRAAKAYTLALGISRLDRASWFALGCLQLEQEEWISAVESFTRCVQLDDRDAESWSNLAVALLRLDKPMAALADVPETDREDTATTTAPGPLDDEETMVDTEAHAASESLAKQKIDPYRHLRDALRALRRAATLKRDDARIWDNYLTVAASIPPSADTPWGEVIQAMGRVVELRGKKEGEKCIDLKILGVLTDYVTGTWTYPPTGGDKDEGGDGQDHSVGVADEAGTARGANRPEEKRTEQNGQVEKDETSPPDPNSTTTSSTTATATTERGRLPYTARSFLHLIDTQIAPLATSSPALWTLLSRVAQWRRRPHAALQWSEKSWRAQLAAVSASEDFDTVARDQWRRVVDKTVWMMQRYRDLGPLQRERTGGAVEAKWRFKARSAARRVLGRGKAWEEVGDEDWTRLKKAMGDLDADADAAVAVAA